MNGIDPLDILYVDSEGDIWLKEPPDDGTGWRWLRRYNWGAGWGFEPGYDKPLRPVTPIRAYVRGIRHPRATTGLASRPIGEHPDMRFDSVTLEVLPHQGDAG